MLNSTGSEWAINIAEQSIVTWAPLSTRVGAREANTAIAL